MILGTVKPSREASIRLLLAGPTGQTLEFDTVIDTGFTDYLTLPKEIADRLGLRFRESMAYELANGQVDTFDLHEGCVLWDGQGREVIVSLTEGGPLVGMALMNGYRLNIEIIDGGRVEINPLSL